MRRPWTMVTRYRGGIVLGWTMVLAVAARVNPWTGQTCFWNDEAFSWAVARAPLSEVLAMLAEDTHPPGHYLLLHFWMRLFGDSIFVMRVLSGLFSAATVLVAYGVARYGFDIADRRRQELAATAALLCAVNPACVSTAYMARMYAMFGFGTLLGVLGCLLILRRPDRKLGWVTWVTGAVLSLYSHNYGLFVVVGEFLWLLSALVAQSALRRRALMARLLLSAGMIAVAYLPWVPVLRAQAELVRGGFWIPPLKWDALAGLGGQLFAEPLSSVTFQPLHAGWFQVLGIGLGLLVVLPWFGAAAEWLFGAIVLVHGAGIFGSSLVLRQSVFEVRYLLHLVPLAMVVLASRPHVFPHNAGRRCVSAFLVAMVAAIGIGTFAARGAPKEAFREAAEFVATRAERDDLIIGDHYGYLRLRYYLEHLGCSAHTAAYVPDMGRRFERHVIYAPALGRGRTLERLDEITEPRVWIVAWARSGVAFAQPSGFERLDAYVFYDLGCRDRQDVVVTLWQRNKERVAGP